MAKTEICRLVDEGVRYFYSQNELKPKLGANEPDCPKDSIRTNIPRKMPKWMQRKGPSFSYCFNNAAKKCRDRTASKEAQRPQKGVEKVLLQGPNQLN